MRSMLLVVALVAGGCAHHKMITPPPLPAQPKAAPVEQPLIRPHE